MKKRKMLLTALLLYALFQMPSNAATTIDEPTVITGNQDYSSLTTLKQTVLTVEGSGNVNMEGWFRNQNGTVDNYGNIISSDDFDNGADNYTDSIFNNYGTFTSTSSSGLDNYGTIYNEGTMTLNKLLNYNGSTLTNKGTINTSSLTNGAFSGKSTLNNSGQITTGTFTNNSGCEFNNTGDLTASDTYWNDGITNNYGNITANNGVHLGNEGTIDNYGNFNIDGSNTLNGTINVHESGVLNFYGSEYGSITTSGTGSKLLNNSGTVNIASDVYINDNSYSDLKIVNNATGIINNEGFFGINASSSTMITNNGIIYNTGIGYMDVDITSDSGGTIYNYAKGIQIFYDDDFYSGIKGKIESGTLYNYGNVSGTLEISDNAEAYFGEGTTFSNGAEAKITGTMNEIDGRINRYSSTTAEEQGKYIFGDGSSIKSDITSSGLSDKFNFDKASTSGTNITLTDWNFIPDNGRSYGKYTKDELTSMLFGSETTPSLDIQSDVHHTVLSPIRYIHAYTTDDALYWGPTGNGYKDFNPAVMAAPVAAQIGGYLNQLNSYDEAFRNMDMYMLMTKAQRQALKYRNKYAASDSNLVFDPANTPYENTSVWARPYAVFENVKLKRGPKVSNVAWGSFFGGESELIDLGNGWDGMFGAYAGYNGSHQAYDGVSIYQNGGTLGFVGMAYKDNFFTGITANIGSNAANADNAYGSEDFTLLMSGIASKTGYNWELADGKFIIQPSWLMSYSFVNTFDYTNSAGIRINSDPLHAIQLEPGLKFIGNLNNGWQPYAGVSVVWNIIDKTDFSAYDATLPELSIKPFVKYGIGIRKTWGERITGFFQSFFTGGGRNGVGLQAGVRITLGSSGEPKHANSSGERKYIAKK